MGAIGFASADARCDVEVQVCHVACLVSTPDDPLQLGGAGLKRARLAQPLSGVQAPQEGDPHFAQHLALDLGGVRFLAGKPVGPLQRERASLLSREPAARGVLPVRGVHHDLMDGVAPLLGPPRRLCGREPADRTTQVRAVPRVAIVGLIELGEEQIDDGHASTDVGRGRIARRSCSDLRGARRIAPAP